jgi:hypothetical protein
MRHGTDCTVLDELADVESRPSIRRDRGINSPKGTWASVKASAVSALKGTKDLIEAMVDLGGGGKFREKQIALLSKIRRITRIYQANDGAWPLKLTGSRVPLGDRPAWRPSN